MELQERLKTHWKDYLQEGLQRGQSRIIGLMKQGYTVEQIEELLTKETIQNRTQTDKR